MKLSRPLQDVRTIKALLTGAETVAHEGGESLPGAEHLLLSALALPDGTARRAFMAVGADPDALRPAIDAQHQTALRAIGIEPAGEEALSAGARISTAPAGVLRTNASAQEAFQTAAKLAKGGRPSPLTGAHVVVAVAEMEHGTAPRTLRQMGIDPRALAAAARRVLGETRT